MKWEAHALLWGWLMMSAGQVKHRFCVVGLMVKCMCMCVCVGGWDTGRGGRRTQGRVRTLWPSTLIDANVRWSTARGRKCLIRDGTRKKGHPQKVGPVKTRDWRGVTVGS